MKKHILITLMLSLFLFETSLTMETNTMETNWNEEITKWIKEDDAVDAVRKTFNLNGKNLDGKIDKIVQTDASFNLNGKNLDGKIDKIVQTDASFLQNQNSIGLAIKHALLSVAILSILRGIEYLLTYTGKNSTSNEVSSNPITVSVKEKKPSLQNVYEQLPLKKKTV